MSTLTRETPTITVPPTPSLPKRSATPPRATVARKVVIGLGVVVVLAVLAGFGRYVLGVPVPGLPDLAKNADKEKNAADDDNKGADAAIPGVSLVKDKPNTVEVPEDVRLALGIRKGDEDLYAVAALPTAMRPLVLPGSTMLDPGHLARVRARFAPARVVEIGQFHDMNPKTGRSEIRELRPGDRVSKGEILGVFSSIDVGSKKNDLLQNLVQLILDQKVLDDAQNYERSGAIPKVFMLNQIRAVQGDRVEVSRALNNLLVWDIPRDEIDALHEAAKHMAADPKQWEKTPEGRWVSGKQLAVDTVKTDENPWSRVTLRSPFDGVIVERNVHVDEMVVDNTVNLFQVADVSKLLVVASCPEDQLPILEGLDKAHRKWTIQTVGVDAEKGLPGTIDVVGYIIDPNQHTAVIQGYVENPGQRLRAGQFISATVDIPPPPGVVEIPLNALCDDGQQSLVFVQSDPKKPQYTMRRVQVTNRFEHKAFVRSTPIPKAGQLTSEEAEQGLLPKEPLRPGEHILDSGTGELHMALLALESEAHKDSQQEAH